LASNKNPRPSPSGSLWEWSLSEALEPQGSFELGGNLLPAPLGYSQKKILKKKKMKQKKRKKNKKKKKKKKKKKNTTPPARTTLQFHHAGNA
jgi:hypothetical protein